ncbi:aminopeptidase [Pseudomonas taiwanensis]|uniref:aminopeptidase n=1 Tax=Pseudomonas taiwanensis TaxID=470150 RepID=UPI0015BD5473|nr:aminopeptidase [Pseudomonas taiwanensis]NWL79632.1 aminopeptidase [Pseudomonas taiwanensis]
MPTTLLIELLDRIRRPWVPLLGILLLSGCSSLDYYSQLARGQMALLYARQPVQALIDDTSQSQELRQRLALTQEARTFASGSLGLPDNGSYRVYADIQRPYVVWNLFATTEFSLQPETHCFPVAGCVAYRGYYQLGRARGAAALLKQQGLDTWVGGVEAYSTLGWFDDPLLNTMLRWDDDRLAALIFHELAHQQLYIPGDTAFNESFASFVEREGLKQWRASRGLSIEADDASDRRDALTRLVLDTRERLEQLYASGLPAERMRLAKAEAFERMRRDYRVMRDRDWGGYNRYDAWMEGPMNNAKLLPFGLYDQWVPAFAALFGEASGNWAAFYQRARELGELPLEARTQALERLMANR